MLNPVDQHTMKAPSVWLDSYLIPEFKLETIGGSEEGTERGRILLETRPFYSGKQVKTDGQEVYPIVLTLKLSPADGSAYYECSMSIQGNYIVEDSTKSEKEIEEYLTMRCVDDLYLIAKTYIAYMTSHGVYGPLDIPVLKSDGELPISPGKPTE